MLAAFKYYLIKNFLCVGILLYQRRQSSGGTSMRVVLISGLGPTFKNFDYPGFKDTLFDPVASKHLKNTYFRLEEGTFDLNSLRYKYDGKTHKLLRPRTGKIPHLTTVTLQSILNNNNIEYDFIDLQDIWTENPYPIYEDQTLVLLSTTFICNQSNLLKVVRWIREHFLHAILVLGGQLSNLKAERIFQLYPEVDYMILGDGEVSLPLLIKSNDSKTKLADVPNLAFRGSDGQCICRTTKTDVDINAHPSPSFKGKWRVIPYESMRGCPFRCKFCSFPFASLNWRYKSASKIISDWKEYKKVNGISLIKVMDSVFTEPQKRFRKLLDALSSEEIEWGAYCRANVIKDRENIKDLERANCKTLSIGFESMSDVVLEYMNKGVNASQNRKAMSLLADSDIHLCASFMVGYPGETPEEFKKTQEAIINDLSGHFMINVFSLMDETMPVWDDAEHFQLEITDPDNPDSQWKHCGMDLQSARTLRNQTIDSVRWKSDNAVLLLWQMNFDWPLLPHLSVKDNLKIEKALERLGMLPRDYPDPIKGRKWIYALLEELETYNIYPDFSIDTSDKV